MNRISGIAFFLWLCLTSAIYGQGETITLQCSKYHIAAYNVHMLHSISKKIIGGMKSGKLLAYKDSALKHQWAYEDLKHSIDEINTYRTHHEPYEKDPYNVIDTFIFTPFSPDEFVSISLHPGPKTGSSVGITNFDSRYPTFFISYNSLSTYLSKEEQALFTCIAHSQNHRIPLDSEGLINNARPVFETLAYKLYNAALSGKVAGYMQAADIDSNKKMLVLKHNDSLLIRPPYKATWPQNIVLKANDSNVLTNLYCLNSYEQNVSATTFTTTAIELSTFGIIGGVKLPYKSLFFVKWTDVQSLYTQDELIYFLGLMNYLRLANTDKWQFNNSHDINDYPWGK